VTAREKQLQKIVAEDPEDLFDTDKVKPHERDLHRYSVEMRRFLREIPDAHGDVAVLLKALQDVAGGGAGRAKFGVPLDEAQVAAVQEAVRSLAGPEDASAHKVLDALDNMAHQVDAVVRDVAALKAQLAALQGAKPSAP
jgi:hypothetical protein